MNKRRLMLEIVLLFCTFFLSGYLSQGNNPARFADMSAVTTSYLILAIPQILLTLYIIGIQGETTLDDFGVVAFSARDPLRVLAVLLGVFALLVPFLVAALLLPGAARQALERGFRWGLSSPSQLPLAFAFSIVSGYREELFFRSYLLTRFTQLGVPVAFSVAFTALLFSVGHLYEGPAGIAVTAIQGIYLALIFLRLKNLNVIAIVHGLYNFTVFCISLLGGSMLARP